MKKILCIQPLRPEALAIFDARDDITYEVVTDYSPQNLMKHAMNVDAITVRDAPLPAEVLALAPGLKVVSRHGVGYDNVPVAYCTKRGIPVTVVGDVNANAVAEQTMFLMLAAARQGARLDRAVREGDFAARSRYLGVELRGRTLLVVGYGRIGRAVAFRAKAFGMKIVAFDPYADPTLHADTCFAGTFEEGLAQADMLSLHIPLSEVSRNLVNADALARMKPGAIVINTARGGIVDEAALVEALDSGHIRAAGLDTFETEPLPATHPLASHEKVVLSPHSAALTDEALIGMGVMTVKNVLAALDGTLDPTLVVNREVLEKANA